MSTAKKHRLFKTSIISLLLFGLLSILILPAFAEEPPTVFLEGGNVAAGETLTLSFYLEEPLAVTSGGVRVVYDTTALRLVEGSWKLSGTLIASYDMQKDLGVFLFGSERTIEGLLFEATFEVLEDCPGGSYPVSMTLTAKNGTFAYESAAASANVLVGGGATLEGGTIKTGETLTLPLKLEGGKSAKSGSVRILYDRELLTLTGATFQIENSVLAYVDSEKGLGAFTCSKEEVLEGTILLLTFTLKEGAAFESTDVSFVLTLKDGKGTPAPDLEGSATVKMQKGDPLDLDGSGKVTIGDVTLLLDHLAGKSAEFSSYATPDINKDGKVTIGDVTALLDHLSGSAV